MRSICVAVLGAALLGGCAVGETNTTDEDEVRSALQTFLTACASEESFAASLNLTEAARGRLLRAPTVLEGCRETAGLEAISALPEALQREALEGAAISSLRVDGGFGSARLETSAGAATTVELESSRGLWLISGPAPSG